MRVLVLGCGFVGQAFGAHFHAHGAEVFGTTRSAQSGQDLARLGIRHLSFDGVLTDDLRDVAKKCDVLLQSIPPGDAGDLAFQALGSVLQTRSQHHWIGYLSTTGVYGDRQGGWAFETDPPTPLSKEANRRAQAEQDWLSLPNPAHVFRLPGIYGPGRSALDQVLAGTARRIDRPGQVFSRAHRDDIVSGLVASIDRPNAGRIYNVCDDLPCASGEVVVEACRLLAVPTPPLIPFDKAGLSEMGQRFYSECKRVSNARIKAELGWRPRFPTYHEGLADCLAQVGPA